MLKYKKASRIGLRFPTTKGFLSVEQVWSLPQKDLEHAIKKTHEEIKKEGVTDDDLSFLAETAVKSEETELNELRFEILKDIYQTKKAEAEALSSEREKKAYNKKILDIIAKKEEEDLNNLSVEDLRKKLIE